MLTEQHVIFSSCPKLFKALFVFEIIIQPETRTKVREQGRKN